MHYEVLGDNPRGSADNTLLLQTAKMITELKTLAFNHFIKLSDSNGEETVYRVKTDLVNNQIVWERINTGSKDHASSERKQG
jgi:hypothetical protein